NRGQDGEWIDLAYHSPRDVLARVDRASVDEAGRLVRALAAEPPPEHAGDGFWLPLVANVVIPRWALIAFELVLIALLVLGLGAPELAWIWLVPAAIAALLPRVGIVALLLPVVLVLAPDQLREAAWNGFLPASVPLAAWLAVLGAPVALAVGHAVRRSGPS